MRERIWWQSPALVLAIAALFMAMGGTVYAAKKIDGKAIRAKSLPGNRLKPRSVPPNRLKLKPLRKLLRSTAVTGPLTGADIDEPTLGQVPSASHAERADFAQSAGDAQTALNAVNAIDAQTVNGHTAGCLPGTRLFAGACWQSSASLAAATAPQAAASCAAQGGTLPDALHLAAFSKESGVNLHEGDEWSNDIVVFSDVDLYGVANVSPSGQVKSVGSTSSKHYRCVIPLVR